MRLESRDGTWFDLRVLRRQRLELRGARPGNDWCADWLVLRGEACVPDGRRWAFVEPCLTPWEGQRLGEWLRAVAGRGGEPVVPRGSGLLFAEPLLSLAFDDARADRRLLRVHLTGAAAWPDPADGRPRGGGFALDLTEAGLLRAADAWSAALPG
ncbi:hypothetical protein OF117_00940 [Geodermatophilus sp. YIM 151500]|uniref:WapI family immunity protein n=1 Tax=Geodermatophilus sp. YIM 151500 TaxID=2984531 RepID=UPI0021E49A0D|nr:hypothetical protein [Geodermatophilus sp. YIM 151500]MCV2487913.1 hypothetical protein [Geodermatophilus sp. YIM 151500]